MNRKQKIIVSITGIFIVMLALVGLTYGYFLTQIIGNEKEKSISVTTANLELRYDDVTEDIILDGAMPNTTVTKKFTVTNSGNAKVNDYQVYLENVVNELVRKDDLVYTLTCSTNDETNSPCTNEITSETTLPNTNGVLLTNSLDSKDVHTYTLTLSYKEMNVDQSIDMNKRISVKINIYDKNDLNTLTLGHYILSNGAQVLNATTNELEIDKTYVEKTQITKVSDGTDMEDVGIFTAPDDYGTSYYYRGPVKNNYVDFAGFMWRIVRINGDGSIRLILDGTTNKICVEYNADNTCKKYAGKEKAFNEVEDNAYIGYMYGSINQNSYNKTHINNNSSIAKKEVDNFYKTYLLDNYNGFIADTMFCGDKSLASAGIGGVETQLGYGLWNETYYAATERLLFRNDKYDYVTPANPTLKCAEGETNTYSRYTVNTTELPTGVKTNANLTYPIALLSADEIVLAGAFRNKNNQAYYLYDAYNEGLLEYGWWLMTPFKFKDTTPMVFRSTKIESIQYGIEASYPFDGMRPVINLRSNVLIESGDGTSGSGAYKVKLAS